MLAFCPLFFFFFFNDTATTEIYTLSLHDALPISAGCSGPKLTRVRPTGSNSRSRRSEEHTSELQSRPHLVCRLLLEKKKQLRQRPHLLPETHLIQPAHLDPLQLEPFRRHQLPLEPPLRPDKINRMPPPPQLPSHRQQRNHMSTRPSAGKQEGAHIRFF